MSVVYFLLFLGFLIFFHEFGHYIFARLLGIKVLTFSFGFGPRLIGFKWGDTDYRLSAIPLGGYVRMLGDDPQDLPDPQDWDKGFLTAPVWKKSLIALAGPGFSLLLPFLAFLVIYSPKTRETASVLGTVIRQGPAWQAGLRSGDRVVGIEGAKVKYWWQMKQRISAIPGKTVSIAYVRNGKTHSTQVTPIPVEDPLYKMLGINRYEGMIKVSPVFRRPTVLVRPGGLADYWGMVTGDAVRSVNGREVFSFEALRAKLDTCLSLNRSCALSIIPASNQKISLKVTLVTIPGVPLGIERADNVVKAVVPKSPMDKIGVKPGDRLLRLDGQPIYEPILDLADLMSTADRPHKLTFLHADRIVTREFNLKNPKWRPGVQAPKYLAPGVTTYSYVEPGKQIPIDNRVTYATAMAIQNGKRAIMVSIASMWALFSGRVSMREMGGPIMIYDIADKAGRSGWMSFLSALAWISASIGLLNLLPIPVLDGGHLLLFSIEAIRRKQVSMKTRQIVTYIGFSVLMALMVLVFANDIMRKLGMF